MINPETLSKAKEKEVFKTFMEAFNTGTLPHDKFYDIPKYEKRMDSLRNGETIETTGGVRFSLPLPPLTNARLCRATTRRRTWSPSARRTSEPSSKPNPSSTGLTSKGFARFRTSEWRWSEC